jgi:hypothetical protein
MLLVGALLARQHPSAAADQASSTKGKPATAAIGTPSSRAASTASGVTTLAAPPPSQAPSGSVHENFRASNRPANKKKTGRLTEAQALTLVANRSEVRAWKQQITTDRTARQRGCTTHIQLDRKEQGSYVVQVFEEVPDGDGSSHTATFNWYHVNEKTGKVTREL